MEYPCYRPFYLAMAIVLALGACGEQATMEPGDNADQHLQPFAAGDVLVLGTAHGYTSSALSRHNPNDQDELTRDLVQASGDAALRRLGGTLAILNRGGESNIHFVGNHDHRGLQVSLPGCGPHDAELLPSNLVVVSCYEAGTLLTINRTDGAIVDEQDLSHLADADGNPELDQLIVTAQTLWVSAQRLDRQTGFSTTGGSGLIQLPLSPLPNASATSDGGIAVGCAGDFKTPSTAGIMLFDLQTQVSIELLAGDVLGGPPTAIESAADGGLLALVYIPNPQNSLLAKEMKLIRINGIPPQVETTTISSSAGFALSGLAQADDGRLFFGNRSTDSSAGLYEVKAVDQTASIVGPFKPRLPPIEIVVF